MDCGTHWRGGPDFVVEVVSPGDRTRDKLDFYSGIGVRELLAIDRDPWMLELYWLEAGRLERRGSSVDGGGILASQVVPLGFRLLPHGEQSRPLIEVQHTGGSDRTWSV